MYGGGDMKAKSIVEEAVKILKDYPHLKYYEALEKAKEVIADEARGSDKSARVSKDSL